MATTAMLNSPCNIGAVKFDVKVKPSLHFPHKLPPMRLNRRQMLTIRASNEGHNNRSGPGPLRKMGLTDEECEAAVVAGNVPEAPPVPPKPVAPAGTPVVSSLPIIRRPRRNRKSPADRAAFQETNITPANLVYPLFIHEGEEDTPIGAMPGCYRLGWRHGLIEEVSKTRDVGVNSIVLFPKVPDALKEMKLTMKMDWCHGQFVC